jgi:AcrR family transcriptional regulator
VTTGQRRRAPRGTLSAEVIVAAAIAVIDTDGLDALTTGRLADDLGVRPMALYTYFRDKDAIVRAAGLALLDRFAMPEDRESDVEMLREIIRAYFQLLVDHPALLKLDALIEDINPAEARISEAIYGCLERLGLDHRSAVGFKATLLRLAMGSALVYPSRQAWDDNPAHWDRIRRQMAALDPDTHATMHELSQDYPAFSQREVFEFGLDTLLRAVGD